MLKKFEFRNYVRVAPVSALKALETRANSYDTYEVRAADLFKNGESDAVVPRWKKDYGPESALVLMVQGYHDGSSKLIAVRFEGAWSPQRVRWGSVERFSEIEVEAQAQE